MLLKLDADTLKSEIDISAYGTRVAIEEAIDAIRPTSECKWLRAANATDFFHPPLIHNISHNVASPCRHYLLASLANAAVRYSHFHQLHFCFVMTAGQKRGDYFPDEGKGKQRRIGES